MRGPAVSRIESVSRPESEGIDTWSFAPSASRALSIDRRLREMLSESVGVLADAITIDNANLASQLHQGIGNLSRGPVSPIAFALYSDLVLAASQDDFDAITSLADAWCQPQFGSADRDERIINLHDDDLGHGNSTRVARIIDDEAEAPLSPQSVADETISAFRSRFDEAMALIRTVDPEMAGEIDVFCRRIILAEPRPGTRHFSGGTTFFLWGATLMNPQVAVDRIALVKQIAHEATHALLFGLTKAKPLTTNSPDERRASPLRPEPRPIEGIVHATFVLARVNHILIEIARGNATSGDERDTLRESIDRQTRLYRSGLATIETYARFTPEGGAIFDSCRAAALRMDAEIGTL